MKAFLKSKMALLLASALAAPGCSSQAQQSAGTPAVPSGSAATVNPSQTVSASPATAVQPDAVQPLPAELQELVKLAERGLGDEVLIAWVKNSAKPFRLTSDEVVYLTDLGVSEAVIKAILDHQGTPAATVTPAPTPTAPINPPVAQAPPAPAPSATVTASPEFETAPQQPPPQTQVTYIEQPAPVQYNYFYSNLAPYGSWIEVSGFGLCWRPTVAVIDTGWRPYCQGGRWVYTNCGWYWQSDYSWGWAPFHYGRWHRHAGSGWVWVPDTVWSPAWVTWRYSDSYCGWAPLPPGSHYRSGVGLTYRSAGVSMSFDFGIERDCYTFVPSRRFCDRTPWRHAVPHGRLGNAYHQTTVINNINVNSHNTIVNEGPGRDRIAALTRSEVPKVQLRDIPRESTRTIRSDRMERGGKELAVYRPFNASVPADRAASSERHETTKIPPATSPRGAAVEKTPPPAGTISGAQRPPVFSAPGGHSSSASFTSQPAGSPRTAAEVSVPKPGVETRAAAVPAERRASTPPTPMPAPAAVRNIAPAAPREIPGATAPSGTPGKPAVESRVATPPPAQSINPSVAMQPRGPIYSQPAASRAVPAPASVQPAAAFRAPPAPQPQAVQNGSLPTRQEISKPPVAFSPGAPERRYSPAPSPQTGTFPAYSSAPTIQSVPRQAPSPMPPPQSVTAAPRAFTPAPMPAPARVAEPARGPVVSIPRQSSAPSAPANATATRGYDRDRDKK